MMTPEELSEFQEFLKHKRQSAGAAGGVAYKDLVDEEGRVYCAAPVNGGPVEISGKHPEDYFRELEVTRASAPAGADVAGAVREAGDAARAAIDAARQASSSASSASSSASEASRSATAAASSADSAKGHAEKAAAAAKPSA